VRDISQQVETYGALDKVPAAAVKNVRNDMYLASEALRFLLKDKANNLKPEEVKSITAFKGSLDKATRFISLWVKVAVAIALGLGTMIGWKRIVVTVGEKIGKTHLTYAQGASAELVAMATIGAADAYGLPVSTTHVLSSGVAGTMMANGSGLQWGDGAQPNHCLGADAPGLDLAFRLPLLRFHESVLIPEARDSGLRRKSELVWKGARP
jgi:inorganic phosphate transporter, PiT family